MRGRRSATSALAVTLLGAGTGVLEAQDFSVLVFSRTAGFRHASIVQGTAAIEALGAANGFEVDSTEDPAVFTDANLAGHACVIFLNTTGDVLGAAGQAAFERYIRAGGGYAGIHSAADTEYGWPWYGELAGAYFHSHPAIQDAAIRVEERSHASTAHLPADWLRRDEWYNFRRNPRGSVHVLATLDESTYAGGNMGSDHPISWCHFFDGGRAWYTAGGHTAESYSEPLFRAHLLGGILFASGMEPACGPPVAGRLPGDCNQDRALDIADAVCLLAFLFSQEAPLLPCGDGSGTDPANVALLDFNGELGLELGDALGLLDRLFLGGPPHGSGKPCAPIKGCEDIVCRAEG